MAHPFLLRLIGFSPLGTGFVAPGIVITGVTLTRSSGKMRRPIWTVRFDLSQGIDDPDASLRNAAVALLDRLLCPHLPRVETAGPLAFIETPQRRLRTPPCLVGTLGEDAVQALEAISGHGVMRLMDDDNCRQILRDDAPPLKPEQEKAG